MNRSLKLILSGKNSSRTFASTRNQTILILLRRWLQVISSKCLSRKLLTLLLVAKYSSTRVLLLFQLKTWCLSLALTSEPILLKNSTPPTSTCLSFWRTNVFQACLWVYQTITLLTSTFLNLRHLQTLIKFAFLTWTSTLGNHSLPV